MRKLIFTLLMALVLGNLGWAQTVIFDPATFTGDLPNKMSIVDIDGTKYLQVIVDGWNSTLNVPEVTTILGTQMAGYVRFRQGTPTVEAGLTLDKIVTAVQVMDTVNRVPNPWGAGTIPSSTSLTSDPSVTEFTYLKKDLTPEMKLAHQIQFFGQEKNSWGPTWGDTIWVSKIVTVDASVLFDPATVDVSTLPEGMEIVEEDGTKLLKVKVNGWNSNLAIPAFEMGKNNKMTVSMKYDPGTSGVAATDVKAFVQPTGGGVGLFAAIIDPAPTALTEIEVDAKPNVTATGLQIAAQENSGNYNAITDAYVYVSKITVSYYELVPVDPTNTADIVYIGDKGYDEIVIDGLYEDAYEESAINNVARVALGTVNGVAAAAGAVVTENNDNFGLWQAVWDLNYFYFWFEATDNTIVDLGESTQPWNNDGIEIFFDIQDRRYEGASRIDGEQHQVRFNVGTTGPAHGNDETGANALGMPGFFNINDTTNIPFAVAKGSNGYIIEVAVPWATFFRTNTNTNLTALDLLDGGIFDGKKIAFEVSLLDAEVLDTRESILNWGNNTGQDKAYETNEFWGEITLKGGPNGIITKKAAPSLVVYPNPASTELNIEMANVSNVQIYNVLGAKVANVQLFGNNKVDVSTLTTGVYVVKATDSNGKVAVTKFNKK
ncbi:MAG: T9SS type A sorting domain-containing protein [Salinivirgaceae bacterium]|nr:T9SS type A sorting domain-containing protein [Salinivirgaceae bacterium]